MRAFLGLVFAAALIAAPMTGAAAKEPISKAQISEALTAEGYKVVSYGPDRLRVDVGSQPILIVVDGPDGDISYITYISGLTVQQVGYQFLSSFNRDVKFGRAYVDGDGDITLQMDRNSSGGVSMQNVVSDLDVFVDLVSRFMSELERRASA